MTDVASQGMDCTQADMVCSAGVGPSGSPTADSMQSPTDAGPLRREWQHLTTETA